MQTGPAFIALERHIVGDSQDGAQYYDTVAHSGLPSRARVELTRHHTPGKEGRHEGARVVEAGGPAAARAELGQLPVLGQCLNLRSKLHARAGQACFRNRAVRISAPRVGARRALSQDEQLAQLRRQHGWVRHDEGNAEMGVESAQWLVLA